MIQNPIKKFSLSILFAYVLLIHCILILVFIYPDVYKRIASKINNNYQNNKVEYSRASLNTMLTRQMQNANRQSILFIGDSLVQGLNTSEISPNVINLGIGHDQINHVMQRLKTYPNVRYAKKIIIHVGINDIRNHPLTEVKQRYKALLSTLAQHQDVVVSGVLPVEDKDKPFNEKIRNLNEYIAKEVSNFPMIRYLPPPKAFFSSENSLLEGYHIGDGLHLNMLGNAVWIEYLKRNINE